MPPHIVLELDYPPCSGPDGKLYHPRACGRERADGLWEGWFEFEPFDGTRALTTSRETTQPNRTDLEYWANGITGVYLEGALDRAKRVWAVSAAP
jgi:hypothetical protein